LAANVRYYLDENVPIAVAEQLRRRGIDAITTRDLGLLGESDINHLNRAIDQGRVLYTHDTDYLDMAFAGVEHSGIIFGQQARHGVGDWVRFLELAHGVYTSEDMKNRLEYV
jgi:hypothetical protein